MLAQIEANNVEYVKIPGRKKQIKIGFLHDYTMQKITELLLEREEMEEAAKSEEPNMVMRSAIKHPYFSVKMAALAVLNDPLKIALLYPFVWRWWAFVRKYNEAEIASVTMAVQKKNKLVLHTVLSDYRVLDGYEDGLDESDEGRSRAVPSRTHAGQIAAFVKDFPCYGDTKWIPFVGRITNYTARCVLTIPQIRIMQADLPHTLYFKTNKDGKVIRNVSKTDKAALLQEEANRKARERRAREAGEMPYTMEEIFKK